jgi:hypothetical protein
MYRVPFRSYGCVGPVCQFCLLDVGELKIRPTSHILRLKKAIAVRTRTRACAWLNGYHNGIKIEGDAVHSNDWLLILMPYEYAHPMMINVLFASGDSGSSVVLLSSDY